jgi:autotransporter-associated beta strand protein
MKIKKQISSRLRLLGVALAALTALSISTQPLHAGTSWTGGGGADTTVTNALNWGGVVNSLDGTTTASFSSSTTLCTLNTNAYFTSVTFSPQSAAGGFTIAGPSNLVVKGSASGGTKNITVSSGSLGNSTNNAPLQVNTTAALLVMQVNKAVTLAINNGISASSGTYTLRHEGVAGSTARIAGPITGLAGVQMASGTWAGDLIIAGNQSLGSADVTINNSAGYGIPALTARLILGESLADVQTWRNFTFNRFMDCVINGSVTAGSFNVQSNAVVEVPGSLAATTLTLGSAGQTGSLKVSGTAYFSGAVTVGSTAGNTIVGNSASTGTLALSSGTISGNVTIGGGGANQNSLTLTKTNSGTLTLGGTHTYSGATLVQAGRLDLTGTIASSVTVSNGATLGGEGSTTGSITFAAGSTSVYFDPTTPGVLTANSINASAGTVVINPTAVGDGVVL